MKRKVIALTGGIGSGKSIAAQILRGLGFDTLDCDVISREAAKNADLLQQVKGILGEESVLDGSLNRAFVREKIYSDEKLYNAYCKLFWNEISRLLQEKLQSLGNVVFVEIPLMEAFPFKWDEVWFVESNVETRFSRVSARDGLSLEQVKKIAAKQPEYLRFTRKITNNGSVDALQAEILQALQLSHLV